jgi:nicotinate phosphoribosyltransferase
MGYVGRDEDYEEPLAAPSAMWADLYALTMAQTLFLEGRHEQQATFHAFVRKTPPYASYLISAGQNIVAEWLDKNWKFTDRDIRRLEKKMVADPKTGEQVKLFKPEFLEVLKNAKLEISLDMMPEGELAFPTEPVYKVGGPIWQCLMVEAAILNTMNSQSNFATYGSTLKTAANGKMVAEFGLRRSQAVGGLSSTRGSYIGGIDATSNCWAETVYGIPTIGTMAHAYVMVHETEMDAYVSWAKHNPHLGVFLPDTYDPEKGMVKVIEACKQTGIELQGFRQDSGDLGYLADLGRRLGEEAGFTKINKNGASNDLDAAIIHSLEEQYSSAFNMYAVGTKLATMADYPALGGVYKVGNVYENGLTHQEIAMKQAVRSGAVEPQDIRDKVRDIMKLSNQTIKMTYPGELDLIRYLKNVDGKLMIDGGTICQEWTRDPLAVDDPSNPLSGHLSRDILSVRRDNHIMAKSFNAGALAYRPLQPVFKAGVLVGDIETVQIARERALSRLDMLDPSYKRLLNPREMVVGVEEGLLQRQEAMGRRLRASGNTVEANLV